MLYRLEDHPGSTAAELARLSGFSVDRLLRAADRLTDQGLLAWPNDRSPVGAMVLTTKGRSAVERLADARRENLAEMLGDWSPTDRPELIRLIHQLAHDLRADDERLLVAAGVEQPT